MVQKLDSIIVWFEHTEKPLVVGGRMFTVLLFCLKTYKHHWLLEVEWSKSLIVFLCCLKASEDHEVLSFMEHHAAVLGTPGLANLCWHRRGGSRASKHVLVHTKSKITFLEKVNWGSGSQGGV